MKQESDTVVDGNVGDGEVFVDADLQTIADFKLIKPKFASNIQEAKRLMKIRKKLKEIEKQNKMNLANMNLATKSVEVQNSNDDTERNNSCEHTQTETTKKSDSPLLETATVSAAKWDALEAELQQSIEYPVDYDDADNPVKKIVVGHVSEPPHDISSKPSSTLDLEEIPVTSPHKNPHDSTTNSSCTIEDPQIELQVKSSDEEPSNNFDVKEPCVELIDEQLNDNAAEQQSVTSTDEQTFVTSELTNDTSSCQVSTVESSDSITEELPRDGVTDAGTTVVSSPQQTDDTPAVVDITDKPDDALIEKLPNIISADEQTHDTSDIKPSKKLHDTTKGTSKKLITVNNTSGDKEACSEEHVPAGDASADEECLYVEDEDAERTKRYFKFISETMTQLEAQIKDKPGLRAPQNPQTVNVRNANTAQKTVTRNSLKRKLNDEVDLKSSGKKFNAHHVMEGEFGYLFFYLLETNATVVLLWSMQQLDVLKIFSVGKFTIPVDGNFPLPLSPAESDKSVDKKLDSYESVDKTSKKPKTESAAKIKTGKGTVGRIVGTDRNVCFISGKTKSLQRYSNEDLYKPRLFFNSRRRSGRILPVEWHTVLFAFPDILATV